MISFLKCSTIPHPLLSRYVVSSGGNPELNRCMKIAHTTFDQIQAIDLSKKYQRARHNFIDKTLREFDGPLKKDLRLVRFCDKGTSWWMPDYEANRCSTLEDVGRLYAHPSSWSRMKKVLYAKVPKGTHVHILKGRASPQKDPMTGAILPGGGMQYYWVDEFNPKWILEVKKISS